MKLFSGQKLVTGILTLFCILLLSTTAMAAETKDKKPEETQVESAGPQIEITEDGSKDLSPSGNKEKASEEVGPGIKKKAEPESTEPVFKKGDSLGLFSITGYCPCSKCSGEHCITYSGTIPQSEHTISADITLLPLGTKVMIDGVVYTVEDIGSSVDGNKVDIFFDSHEEALDFGRQSKEVFEVIES